MLCRHFCCSKRTQSSGRLAAVQLVGAWRGFSWLQTRPYHVRLKGCVKRGGLVDTPIKYVIEAQIAVVLWPILEQLPDDKQVGRLAVM